MRLHVRSARTGGVWVLQQELPGLFHGGQALRDLRGTSSGSCVIQSEIYAALVANLWRNEHASFK